MSTPYTRSVGALVVLTAALRTVADPVDWVNIDYVLQQAKEGSDETAKARNTIIKGASWTAKKGPWTITNSDVLPPSEDVRDYLSWAPYHWPNCRWCTNGRNHLAKPGGGDGEPADSPSPSDPANGGEPGSDPYSEGSDFWYDHSPASRRGVGSNRRSRHNSLGRAMQARLGTERPVDNAGELDVPDLPISGTPTIPFESSSSNDPTTTSAPYGTPPPNNAAAKKTTSAQCAPSPTTSMAPRETWTTCPYVVRDGKVNPDVRSLTGVQSINELSQAVLFNALTYVLEGQPDNAEKASSFIDQFFLNPSTGMKPHLDYGQMVRGPGKTKGTFTGILDFRMMIKIVNAIAMMKAMASQEWEQKEAAMQVWMAKYAHWLTNSSIGKITASKVNNHLSFYAAQVAAVQIFIGDEDGAAKTLKGYFEGAFLDQVAKSGEQPFEVIRTRPFHYRCFNLEAMIACAKLGDQLGLDFWSAKSKYGATIKTVVDYTMSVKPGKEKADELAPHVAAVRAAYGDPQGKYAAFLKKTMPQYPEMSFWFYDQPEALTRAPARSRRRESSESPEGAEVQGGLTAFQCPSVFDIAKEIELDNGIFVTCDELRPFYEIGLVSDGN